MTEKSLPFKAYIVPQEKYWDCAPASVQVVLSALGITKTEDQLIKDIGTTVNGTDYVGLTLKALNKYTGGKYVARYASSDPIRGAQKEQLWADIVRSIDAGYGLVANIVAPPTDYPRGVKGSKSPSYGGGTIFHYVPLMGYDDNPKLRAVRIPDPGFSPFDYWVSFDQLCSLIPPNGWATATVSKAADPVEFDVWSQLWTWPQLGGRSLVDAVAVILEHVDGS